MKKSLCLSVGLTVASIAAANNAPLWLRDAAISPDGGTVAFTFKGDIFTVPTSGGEARQITTSHAYDSAPLWSPDGGQIVFRSNREGSDDIFVIPAKGGTARRITTSSGSELPIAFLPDGRLLFVTHGMPGRTSAQAPFGSQTYVVSISEPNARPQLYLSLPMTSASVAADGRMLYQDRKGYENIWRKHERSSSTADIWLVDNNNFSKLTDFSGHDMNPVWSADGKHY
ncbi:MAG: peptidase S41, partial [Paramuribaculum sp.]|nr:peptidase S41 [Paramuribaculum sp.]